LLNQAYDLPVDKGNSIAFHALKYDDGSHFPSRIGHLSIPFYSRTMLFLFLATDIPQGKAVASIYLHPSGLASLRLMPTLLRPILLSLRAPVSIYAGKPDFLKGVSTLKSVFNILFPRSFRLEPTISVVIKRHPMHLPGGG